MREEIFQIHFVILCWTHGIICHINIGNEVIYIIPSYLKINGCKVYMHVQISWSPMNCLKIHKRERTILSELGKMGEVFRLHKDNSHAQQIGFCIPQYAVDFCLQILVVQISWVSITLLPSNFPPESAIILAVWCHYTWDQRPLGWSFKPYCFGRAYICKICW